MLLGGAAEGDVDGRSVLRFEVAGSGLDGVEFGAGLQQTDAAIPAENAVVIADGADFLGFGKMVEGFFDKREKDVG